MRERKRQKAIILETENTAKMEREKERKKEKEKEEKKNQIEDELHALYYQLHLLEKLEDLNGRKEDENGLRKRLSIEVKTQSILSKKIRLENALAKLDS